MSVSVKRFLLAAQRLLGSPTGRRFPKHLDAQQRPKSRNTWKADRMQNPETLTKADRMQNPETLGNQDSEMDEKPKKATPGSDVRTEGMTYAKNAEVYDANEMRARDAAAAEQPEPPLNSESVVAGHEASAESNAAHDRVTEEVVSIRGALTDNIISDREAVDLLLKVVDGNGLRLTRDAFDALAGEIRTGG